MKFIFVLLSILLLLPSFAYAESGLSLWEKAREIALENWRLVPGYTRLEMVTYYTRSEKVIQSTDVTVAHVLDEEGEIVNSLVEKESNSEEIDEADQDRMLEGLLNRDMTPKKDSMFLSQDPENPVYEPLNQTKEIKGFLCKAYSFEYESKHEDKPATYTGTAWLDSVTGAPILLTFTIGKMPIMVREFSIDQYYHYDPETNVWYQEKIETTANISLILRRLTNETTTTYWDYWKFD